MARHYVNDNAHANGGHEVHREGCSFPLVPLHIDYDRFRRHGHGRTELWWSVPPCADRPKPIDQNHCAEVLVLTHEIFDKTTQNYPPPGFRLPDAGFPGAVRPGSAALGSTLPGWESAPQKIPRRHNTPVRCLKQEFPRDFSFQGTLVREN